ncbi:DUF3822 family protein [Gangjinia marincola]|uniref:DUF3822 family protein n=1 Tax=Gangjinia marincola TaxID=578463 RepID=A0ABN1MD93_9FLAO
MTTTSNKYTTQIELSILVHQNGLSFCTLDKEKKEVTQLEHTSFKAQKNPIELLDQINFFFEKYSIEKYSYDKVNIVYANDLYAIVPHEVFDENHVADYLKYSIKILKTDFIVHDQLASINAHTVFIPLTNINNYIFERFGSFEYRHSTSILIDNLSSLSRKTEQPYLYLHVMSTNVDVLFFKDQNLLLCNTFSYHTPEDFIYYVLFCFEQLKFDTNLVETILFGNISKESTTYNLLYKYIKHISFLDVSKIVQQTASIDKKETDASALLLLSL